MKEQIKTFYFHDILFFFGGGGGENFHPFWEEKIKTSPPKNFREN